MLVSVFIRWTTPDCWIPERSEANMTRPTNSRTPSEEFFEYAFILHFYLLYLNFSNIFPTKEQSSSNLQWPWIPRRYAMGTGRLPRLCLDPGLLCHLEIDQIISQSALRHSNPSLRPDRCISGPSINAGRCWTWTALLFQTELGFIKERKCLDQCSIAEFQFPWHCIRFDDFVCQLQ